MKIKIADIIEKSKNRPDGYYDDVISRGTIIDDYLEISADEARALQTKYSSVQVSSNFGPPSLIKQAANFAGAVFKHVTGGMEEVSIPIYEERLAKCRTCPFMNNTDIDNPKCNKCGCFLKIKARWATESCPDSPKKWEAVPTQANGGCGSCGGNHRNLIN